jgi:hypothetical protein
MVRSLGSSDKGVPLKPQHSAEGKGERFVDVCDAADGFRAQDLRIEWACAPLIFLARLAILTFISMQGSSEQGPQRADVPLPRHSLTKR